ncbi:hypothetical protein NKH18_48485 [Streptomyces sp. M10(2022)]
MLGVPSTYGVLVEAEAAAQIVQAAGLDAGSPSVWPSPRACPASSSCPYSSNSSSSVPQPADTRSPRLPVRRPPRRQHLRARRLAAPAESPPCSVNRTCSLGESLLAHPLPSHPSSCCRRRRHGDRQPVLGADRLGPEPRSHPSTSASSAPKSAGETESGGVAILKKDPGGDVVAGAAFTLRLRGEGGCQRQDQRPGAAHPAGPCSRVYRLKETSSGSPLHDTVDDQDVIVTPGVDTPLTIVDPFKDASVLLKAKDDKTGKLLAGSTVNIGSGDKTLLTLTTGSDGTASGKLPSIPVPAATSGSSKSRRPTATRSTSRRRRSRPSRAIP